MFFIYAVAGAFAGLIIGLLTKFKKNNIVLNIIIFSVVIGLTRFFVIPQYEYMKIIKTMEQQDPSLSVIAKHFPNDFAKFGKEIYQSNDSNKIRKLIQEFKGKYVAKYFLLAPNDILVKNLKTRVQVYKELFQYRPILILNIEYQVPPKEPIDLDKFSQIAKSMLIMDSQVIEAGIENPQKFSNLELKQGAEIFSNVMDKLSKKYGSNNVMTAIQTPFSTKDIKNNAEFFILLYQEILSYTDDEIGLVVKYLHSKND